LGTPEIIGSTFHVKSIFNRNESSLLYKIKKYESEDHHCKIELEGLNDYVRAKDELTFTAISCT